VIFNLNYSAMELLDMCINFAGIEFLHDLLKFVSYVKHNICSCVTC